MSDTVELTPDQLFDRNTSDEQVKAAKERPTIPTGQYRIQIDSVDPQVWGDDKPLPGREVARLGATVFDDAGERKGKVFFTVSWNTYKPDYGRGPRADPPTYLWVQLAEAVNERNVGRALKLAEQYPLNAKVRESFKTPEGKYLKASSEEERAEYVKLGYEASNFVDALAAVTA